MVEQDHAQLSISTQCCLLGVARSRYYYKPKDLNTHKAAQDASLAELIDKLYTADPSLGVERMHRQLNAEVDFALNIKRVRRIYRTMGLVSLSPGPHTSKPSPGHKTYPYLLKSLSISHPNKVWCTDITYLPMKQGHFFLTAIMDWNSRAVLSWRISNTMTSTFCVEALEEAVSMYGAPEIMNTDQGSQYTSEEWIQALENHGITISMDGKGRATDNVMIERLWRSFKYEYFNLWVHKDGAELKTKTQEWMHHYNTKRIHSQLNMPPLVYYEKHQLARPKPPWP